MRTLVLDQVHRDLGARFAELDGVTVAAGYGDVGDEVLALRSAAGVTDLSHRGRIDVLGPDRLSFLDGQSSNALKPLEPGTGALTTFLTGKGKMRGFGVVLADADRFRISTDGGAAPVLMAHLESFVIMDDVRIEDRTADTVELGVHGPQARDVIVGALGGAPEPDAAEHGFVSLRVDGAEVAVIVGSLLGDPNYSIQAPAALAPRLWKALAADARPVGHDAMEVLRIEAGRPRWGAETDVDTIPIEVGLLAAIDYEKGCFTGYEVVARIRTYGHVNRNLVGLRVASGEVAVGAPLRSEERQVGRVTSCARSGTAGGVIALAVVRREVAAAGTELSIADSDSVALVVELPFPRA